MWRKKGSNTYKALELAKAYLIIFCNNNLNTNNMLTINLEKELIRQNKQLLAPEELLRLNEYDKHAVLVENDALSRIGLNNTVKQGKIIKDRLYSNKQQTISFNQERVFHISQIEAICKRYRLRFLQTKHYKGTIDGELPNRITTFEIAYNVICTNQNTMIVAPMESFELQEKPKDPLLFYKINDDYYYLIHKWGNDLSIKRALLPLLENTIFCAIFCTLTIPSSILSILLCFVDAWLAQILSLIFFAAIPIYSVLSSSMGEPIRFISKNNWNSINK